MLLAGSVGVEVYPAFPAWQRRVRAGVTGPEMSRAGQEAGTQVTKGFERGSSRMASVIAGASRAAAGGLLAVASASTVIGVKTAADAETAQIAFTTMLGGAKQAKAFLADLNAFAATTPFDMPGLQTAAQSLISIGLDSKKVIPIMTTLGNVTSGMGTGSEGIQRATVALQQMNAAGKISAEDLNQLRDAGIPVYDLLASATGRSKKELAEMAGKGKLGRVELEKLMKALETGKGLERFNGLMQAQSQSLTGLWSTLKDTFSQGMAKAIQPVIPLLKDGVAGAIALVNENMPELQSGLQWLVTTLPPKLSVLKNAATGLFDLLVKGDYSSALRKAFGWEEDSSAVTRILDIRDAATGLFDLLVKGDYSSALRTAFGWEEDSSTVTQILDIRDAVLEFFAAAKGGDTSGLTDSLSQFKDIARDALAALPALQPVLDLTGAGFKFAADNVDLLVKAMPFLLAAFAAYKAQQAANNLIGRNTLVGFGLQLGSTLALTFANKSLEKSLDGVQRSQKTLIVSTQLATGAENTSTLSKIRSAATTTVKTIAERAAAVASKAMAAGQWLVNAALAANPIGLVIVALLALGAGLVLAYKKSETFRAIVDGALKGVSASASFMWNSVLKPTFRFIMGAFLELAGSIVDGAAEAFGWVPGIGPKLKTAATEFGKFKDRVNASLNGVNDKTVTVGVNFSAGSKVTSGGKKYNAGMVKYAGGGRIPGPWLGPKADNVLGVSDAGVPVARVNPREYITRVWATDRMERNNPGTLAYINRYGELPGRAGGGFSTATRFPSGRGIYEATDYATRDLVAANASALKAALVTVGGGNVNGTGMGWRKQVAWARANIPTAVITSTVRSGNPASDHDKGRAIDLAGGPGMSAIFDKIKGAFSIPSTRSLYYSPKGARQVRFGRESNTPAHIFGTHFDHVHWAMNGGGRVPESAGRNRSRLYDQGGLLMPGVTRAVNLTGRPESILNDGGAAARGQARPARYEVTLVVGSRELAAIVFDEGGQLLSGGVDEMAGV